MTLDTCGMTVDTCAWCPPFLHVCHVLAGGLSLAVEGPSKAEIVCQDNDDGTCTVTYLPTEPGLYNVVVKFDDEHILGSPFTAYIAGKSLRVCLFAEFWSKIPDKT